VPWPLTVGLNKQSSPDLLSGLVLGRIRQPKAPSRSLGRRSRFALHQCDLLTSFTTSWAHHLILPRSGHVFAWLNIRSHCANRLLKKKRFVSCTRSYFRSSCTYSNCHFSPLSSRRRGKWARLPGRSFRRGRRRDGYDPSFVLGRWSLATTQNLQNRKRRSNPQSRAESLRLTTSASGSRTATAAGR
jgi:hypothetical protein